MTRFRPFGTLVRFILSLRERESCISIVEPTEARLADHLGLREASLHEMRTLTLVRSQGLVDEGHVLKPRRREGTHAKRNKDF